jgi:ADP-heptose:LPS heptosyltransferase
MVRHFGSVLKAMSARVGVPAGDFRLPVRPEWLAKAEKVLERAEGRPVMLFRPLVERKEWTGGVTRNPRAADYEALFEAIRRDYFVVSVADVAPGVEWIRGRDLPAGLKFHRGELDTETLFGLAARAALIFCAPGFGTVLGQALGTPGVTVFGGYEDASSFSSGASYAPWLAIEPKTPCPCWRHDHDCPKDIDVNAAVANIREFSNDVLGSRSKTGLVDQAA